MTQAEHIGKLREALIIARGGLLEAIGTSHNMVPAYNAFLNRAEEAVRLALALPSPADPPPGVCAVLAKIASWMEAQAARDEGAAKTCRFGTLTDAYIADSKNYRAMAKDARAALQAALGVKP